ncbi:MAG TPA: TIGR00341 family protein [Halobacteriales archaeon]|nr:TIGR00341 family protein [Halobacteriales archaeon]
MRLVQISVPTGKREAIRRVLDDEEIEYLVTEETGSEEYTEVVTFPLPTNAVEPVLDRLHDAGLPDDAYTIVVDAETVISRRAEALEERYADEEEAPDRISREEIAARAADLSPSLWTFVAMTAASVLIATAGVLLDSPAVVVGSMVIAPLIGPAMATSVGTVLADRELFERGVRLQVLGFVMGIAVAAVFAYLLKSLHLVNFGAEELVAIGEVNERLAPDFLSLAVALAAGFAGAYSLSSGVPSSLVGVAIAVALVPPTAVVGVGIAWGLPAVVAGSTVLVLVNFLSINLAALAVLWYQGYRPRQLFYEDQARTATIKRIAVLAAAIAVLSVFLGGATFFSYQGAVVDEEVRSDVRTVLERPAYQDLVLVDVTVEQGGLPFAPEPQRVVVTVGRSPGQSYPQLADDLAAEIETGQNLAVEVRFVVVQVRTPGSG